MAQELIRVSSQKCLPPYIRVLKDSMQIVSSSKLNSEILKTVNDFGNCWKHVYRTLDDEFVVLERYSKDQWLLWKAKTTAIESGNELETAGSSDIIQNFHRMSMRSIIAALRSDKSTAELSSKVKLNMAVPGFISTNSSHSSSSDPKMYLESRYDDILYSVNVPLAYFVKSTLSKFKNICKTMYDDNTKNYMITVLSGLSLSMKDFDARTENNNIIEVSLTNPISEKSRKQCVKYLTSSVDQENIQSSIKDISMILKFRKIKLQIILLLEIIKTSLLDTEFLQFEKTINKKMKARSLNLIRRAPVQRINKKLKIEAASAKLNFNYFEQLDLFLDKLNILDILISTEHMEKSIEEKVASKLKEQKQNILNKNNEASLYGFINYILIPFYRKDVPNTVQFIIRKLRTPNLRASKSQTESLDPPEISEEFNNFSKGSQTTSIASSPTMGTFQTFPNTTLSDKLGSNDNMSRSSFNLNKVLDSASKGQSKQPILSRSTSDISVLQKRQLSLADISTPSFTSLKTKTISNEVVEAQTEFIESRQTIITEKSSSFKRVGKRKLSKVSENAKFEISRKLDNSTYNANIRTNSESSNHQQFLQVTATPKVPKRQTPNDIRLQSIVESPIVLTEETSTTKTTKIPSASSNPISTSPRKRKVRRRLFAP